MLGVPFGSITPGGQMWVPTAWYHGIVAAASWVRIAGR